MDDDLVIELVQSVGTNKFVFIQPQPPNAARIRDASHDQSDTATKTKKIRAKRHVCPECGRACTSPSTLECHMRIHTGEKPYECPECGFRTAQTYTLRAHMRKHTGEKPFKCNQCDYRSSVGSSLKIHMRRHTGEKPFECPHCIHKTTTKGNLDNHMKRHMRPSEVHLVSGVLSCQSCPFQTSDSIALDDHMKTHPNTTQNSKTNRRMYNCNECGYSCRLPTSLKIHLMKHKKLPDVHCKLCSYKGYTRQALRIHVRRQHSEDRPSYECPTCSKKFTAKPSLQVHMRLHTGERPYPCSICSFRAISRTVHKEHMIRHESEAEKPFPCFLCDARFNWPNEWKEHLFTHKDQDFEKSKYCCPHCEYSSPLRRNLSSHMTMKHRDLVQHPQSFYCMDCKYDYKRRTNWNRHLRLCHREMLEE